jgi:hypothetical protein
MNAMTIADLGLSQDLDRKALAAVIGGNDICGIRLDRIEIVTANTWSGYQNGTLLGVAFENGRLVSKMRWMRTRTQYEYSYWTYFYCTSC